MSWNSLAGNQAVSGSNLLDAVNNGVFSVRPGQGIPNDARCLTRDQVNALISIQPISGNRLAKKNELISVPITNIGEPSVNSFMLCNNDNYIFISETDNHRVIRYPILGGKGVVIAGTGTAGSGAYQLNSPLGIDIINDYLIIADAQNNRVVYCSANGTPGSNLLTTIADYSGRTKPVPVHVSGQVFSATTGLSSYMVSTNIGSFGELYATSAGTTFTYIQDLNGGGLSEYVSSTNESIINSRRYIQFTDIDNWRHANKVNGNPWYWFRRNMNNALSDQSRVTVSASVTLRGILWMPFTVGTGIKKIAVIEDDNVLRILANQPAYAVERSMLLPAGITDVKGISATRYPTVDGNGYPRKPLFILAANRVYIWMNDVFRQILVGADPGAIPTAFYQYSDSVVSSSPVDCGNGWDTQVFNEVSVVILDASGNLLTSHPDYSFTLSSGEVMTVYNGQASYGYQYSSYDCGFSNSGPGYIVSAPIPEYGT